MKFPFILSKFMLILNKVRINNWLVLPSLTFEHYMTSCSQPRVALAEKDFMFNRWHYLSIRVSVRCLYVQQMALFAKREIRVKFKIWKKRTF